MSDGDGHLQVDAVILEMEGDGFVLGVGDVEVIVFTDIAIFIDRNTIIIGNVGNMGNTAVVLGDDGLQASFKGGPVDQRSQMTNAVAEEVAIGKVTVGGVEAAVGGKGDLVSKFVADGGVVGEGLPDPQGLVKMERRDDLVPVDVSLLGNRAG